MNMLDILINKLKLRKTASIAKERLQIVISHERASQSIDLLPKLRTEILAVISKYYPVAEEQISVEIQKQGNCSILELNIALPEASSITV